MTNFEIKAVKTPSDLKEKGFWAKVARLQFIYSMTALAFGAICIIAGLALFVNGVTGSSSWTTKFLGLESTISDAAPGVILFIIGFLVVFLTKFDVSPSDDKKNTDQSSTG